MEDKKNKKNIIYVVVGMLFVIILLIVIMSFIYSKIEKSQPDGPGAAGAARPNSKSGFNNTIIQKINENSENENYMFSPYSLEIVLSMLRDGAEGKTYEELVKLVPERKIKYFSAKERINVANALFIKNKVNIKDDFIKLLNDKYKSQILYDEFNTPDVINDWANKETYEMIPKILEQINPEFLFGLGNAVAIDVEWLDQFECFYTKLEKFNKIDGSTINVAMMHNYYEGETSYFKDSNATYVSIPYKSYGVDGKYDRNGTQLEFIGILPEEDVNSYISSFNFNDIASITEKMQEADSKLNIKVSLPKFKFDYEVDGLKEIFENLGLKETFGVKPEFGKIADYDMNISNMLHKTFIELSEYGTKAAAVTVVTFDATSLPEAKPEVVEINFDKPFVYLIKDSDSDEILFYGVVYSPTEYGENDVLCEEDNF